MDSLTAAPLVGTDGAQFPFWSPDSRFIAYTAQNKLLKIPGAADPTQTLCAVDGTASGAWSRDGVIVFSQGTSALFRVSSTGGQPMPFTRLAAGHTVHHFPSFLPDGRHVLFHVAASSQDLDGTYGASLDTGESKRVLGADSGAVYDRRSEYLLFARQGTLLAQSFDLKTLTVADEPLQVANGSNRLSTPAFSPSPCRTTACSRTGWHRPGELPNGLGRPTGENERDGRTRGELPRTRPHNRWEPGGDASP